MSDNGLGSIPARREPQAPGRSSGRRWHLIAALLISVVQAFLLLQTAWDKADTPDEARYIGGAVVQWARLDFSQWSYCPMPKWAFGAALRCVDRSVADSPAEGWRDAARIHLFERRLPELRRDLFAARCATVAVAIAAGWLLFAIAMRFGPTAAVMAHAMWAFSPTVMANGSLATLDVWVAASVALMLWTCVRLLERPSLARAIGLGIAFGFALGTKILTAVWIPFAVIALFIGVRTRRGSSPSFWKICATVALAAFGTLWGAHGFAFGMLDTSDVATLLGWNAMTIGPMPFPTWFSGALRQVAVAETARRNYLFGVMAKHGFWWYYLAALGLQITVGAQCLGVLRGVDCLRHARGRQALIDLGLLTPPAILFVLFSASDVQSGVRYLLPLFPPVIVWVVRGFGSGAPRWRHWAAAILVLAGAGESLRVHPHYLMFYNVWAGGPEGGPRYLIESSDWGQDQRRLAEWERLKGIEGILYTPYPDHPKVWGIRFKVAPCSPRQGTFALHAAEVHRPKRVRPGCYDWLTVEPPDERIGYSIYIYYVDKERLERLHRERHTEHPFFRGGPIPKD